MKKIKEFLIDTLEEDQLICQTHNTCATVIDFANGKIYCEKCEIVPMHFEQRPGNDDQ